MRQHFVLRFLVATAQACIAAVALTVHGASPLVSGSQASGYAVRAWDYVPFWEQLINGINFPAMAIVSLLTRIVHSTLLERILLVLAVFALWYWVMGWRQIKKAQGRPSRSATVPLGVGIGLLLIAFSILAIVSSTLRLTAVGGIVWGLAFVIHFLGLRTDRSSLNR